MSGAVRVVECHKTTGAIAQWLGPGPGHHHNSQAALKTLNLAGSLAGFGE